MGTNDGIFPLMQELLEASPNAIAVYQAVYNSAGRLANMRLIGLNRLAWRHFQGPPEQLTGQLLSDLPFIDPSTRSQRWKALKQVFLSGEPLDTEEYSLLLSGEDYWASVALRRFDNFVLVTYTDITARKQAEQQSARLAEALKEQMRLVQQVLDRLPVGIILVEAIRDEAGTITDFRYRLTNQYNASLMRLSVDDLTDRPVSEVFHGWQSMSLFEAMKAVTNREDSLHYVEHYDHYGLKAWFDYYFVRQDDGVLLAFFDVTELKEREQAVLRQNELLENVINSPITGVVVYEAVEEAAGGPPDFRYRQINDAALQLQDRPREAFLGRLTSEVGCLQDYLALQDVMLEVYASGQPQHLEQYFEGINLWLELAVSRLQGGLVVKFNDITHRKRAETALHEQTRSLEAANRELRRSNINLQSFAYVASHDLQEPLRKIKSFSDMLEASYGNVLTGAGQDYLQRMSSAVFRMSDLIRDLLTYSRLSTHRKAFEEVDLQKVLNVVLNDLALIVTESGATVEMAALPTVKGDRQQLRQLFQNLLGNALKFRHPSSTSHQVTIQARLISGQDVPEDLGLAPDKTYYQIRVQDTGIGFDPKYRDRIFEVFQRLHGRTGYAGTGIGLAICKQVVINHGGGINAVGESGKGASFYIYLPE